MRIRCRFAARLLLLTPAADCPQVIATDFHITGGAVELRDINWEASNIDSGILIRPVGDQAGFTSKFPKITVALFPKLLPAWCHCP